MTPSVSTLSCAWTVTAANMQSFPFWVVALYLVKGLLVQVFRDLELRAIADALSWAWLGFCVYTWFGPAAFRRALQKEIQGVELDEDF